MAKLSMGERIFRVFRYEVSRTDCVHVIIITALVIACTVITAISFSLPLTLVTYELFLIPVMYTAYYYGMRGLVVTAMCGIVYLATGYFFRSPHPVALMGVASGAFLFVIIAGLLSCFIERIRAGEARYRSVFTHSQVGIVEVALPDFRITQTNETFAGILHYSTNEITRMTLPSLIFTPPEKKRFLERMEPHQGRGSFEIRFRTKEGDSCWANLSWCAGDESSVIITVVDINALKLIEESNNNTLLKYWQLTKNSPTGILVLQEGRIRSANPAFCTFSGYSLEELEGKDLPGVLDSCTKDTLVKFNEQMVRGTWRTNGTELRFVTKSGGLKAAIAFACPVMHDNRHATLINLVDISVQQRLEEKIRQDCERRRNIIMTVAHELRTPLQPILGYLSLLADDPEGFGIQNNTKKMLGRCLASAERERQLINRMLEHSVLDRGKIQLMFEDFSLIDLVGSVLDTGEYFSKGDVTMDIPEDLVITADRDRLYGVLDSILSNAVSCSRPPRKIHISYRTGAGGTTHTISIEDNGIGIPKNMFDSIFEPFQLADAARFSRKYDRLGLSLSIARMIIQMHGGDITVESTLSVGSTFTLHIPRALTEEIPPGT